MTAPNLGADLIHSPTSTLLDQWQELLPRWSAVPAAKVLQAAEVIRGMLGSWAGAYIKDPEVVSDTWTESPRQPPAGKLKYSKLGAPGFPEINFAPYCYGTNRFGNKGGSLVGHQISFSIVGPTPKNPDTNWWWFVTDNSATPGLGDQLTLSDPLGGGRLLRDLYGLTGMGISDFNDSYTGLYLVISLSGDEGTLLVVPPAEGGVGDGCYLDTSPPLLKPPRGCPPRADYNKYEIFRVTAFTDTSITLDPVKRLTTFFNVPSAASYIPVIRGITLLTPAAAPAVALPMSGETAVTAKTFAILPPFRALLNDEAYPYTTWSRITWHEANMEPQLVAGTQDNYLNGQLLPVPRPLGSVTTLRVYSTNHGEAAPARSAGQIRLFVPNGMVSVGQILHITSVQRGENAELFTYPGGYQASLDRLLGWFEVVRDGPGNYVDLRRYQEADPNTGRTYVGSSEEIFLSVASTDDITLTATIHQSVYNLVHEGGNAVDNEAIAASKLTNIIDPRWTEFSAKATTAYLGTSNCKPDRAIFDTGTSNSGIQGSNSNPGSLMDLGFRPVLFAAALHPTGNYYIPYFNVPITSNEVLLDPTAPKTEKQYYEIDYANGLIRLSHQIKSGSPLYPPNGFTGLNARHSMVLFIACVPYSREDGQTGTGVRATGGSVQVAGEVSCTTGEMDNQEDAYSTRITIPVDTSAPQVISSTHTAGVETLTLAGDWALQIPPTGFFELIWGDRPSGTPVNVTSTYRGSVYSYTHVTFGGVNTVLHNVCGGGHIGVDSITINATNPAVAVWRKELYTPNALFGAVGVPLSEDVTYGWAKRAGTLRFDDADIKPNIDGSTSIIVKQTVAHNLEKALDTVFSSVMLTAPSITATVVSTTVKTCTILLRGVRMVVPPQTISCVSGYLYYSSSSTLANDIPLLSYSATLPLPASDDILIAKITIGFPLSTYILGPVLNSDDQHTEIYVGPSGHFATVREAVDFAGMMRAGSDRTWHIRVAGHTLEDCSGGPIAITLDGLTIEGTPQYDPNTGAVVYPEIKWTDGDGITENTPLFDLNGHSSLIFRDLAFRTPVTVQANAVGNFLFVDALPSSNITIDNCMVINYIAGFISVSAGIQNEWTVTKNYATYLRLYGLLFSSTLNYSMISGNALPSDLGVTSGTAVKIKDNIAISITLGATASVASANYLTGDINVNYRSNKIIGNQVGGLLTLSASADNCAIMGNYVAGLMITTAGSDCTIVGNYTIADIVTQLGAGNCTVGDNRVGGNITVGGSHGTCTGNRVLGNILLTAAPSNTVTGNRVENDLTIDNASGSSTISGNRVSGNLVMQASANAVTGNSVQGNLDVATTAPNNAITGNRVTGNITVALTAHNTVLTGNQVQGNIDVTSDATPHPTGLVIVGNHVVGSITCSPGPVIPGSVVVGNHAQNIWGAAVPAASVNTNNSSL